MRVSVFKDDPGYAGLYRGIKVFLHGIERNRVFTADEEKRLVVIAAVDAAGRLVIDRETGEVAQETLYGDVRIELPAHHPLNRQSHPGPSTAQPPQGPST